MIKIKIKVTRGDMAHYPTFKEAINTIFKIQEQRYDTNIITIDLLNFHLLIIPRRICSTSYNIKNVIMSNNI